MLYEAGRIMSQFTITITESTASEEKLIACGWPVSTDAHHGRLICFQ